MRLNVGLPLQFNAHKRRSMSRFEEVLRPLSERLRKLREQELRERNMTPAEIRELRWLEKDYDDENNGDWTR